MSRLKCFLLIIALFLGLNAVVILGESFTRMSWVFYNDFSRNYRNAIFAMNLLLFCASFGIYAVARGEKFWEENDE